MKKCSKCKEYKNLLEFGTHIRKDNGTTYINSRCKHCANLVSKESQKSNPNKKVNSKRWSDNNKEKVREKNKKHRLNNLWKYAAKEGKRRAAKLKQTPKWADLKTIEQFYRNCPEGYHVDHIIPLQGKEVRGLHVLENLQYLPAIENIRKSNKI